MERDQQDKNVVAVGSHNVCGLKKDAVGWTDANVRTIIRRESENGQRGAILLQDPRLAQITLSQHTNPQHQDADQKGSI